MDLKTYEKTFIDNSKFSVAIVRRIYDAKTDVPAFKETVASTYFQNYGEAIDYANIKIIKDRNKIRQEALLKKNTHLWNECDELELFSNVEYSIVVSRVIV